MGRKGVSKRKEKKTKNVIKDAAANSVASVMQASENKPAKSLDTGKGAPFMNADKKSSSDKKNSKKK